MINTTQKLLENVEYTLHGKLPETINSIQINSRQVRESDLFFAIRGVQADGHNFIPQAVENRAAAIITERYFDTISTPQIVVKDSRAALSKMAANYFDHPSKKLKIVGVTGTNGKTTTVFLLNHIFKAAGKSRGTIGTLGYSIDDQFYSLNLTTPDSIQVQEILAKMVASDIESIAMEVSAHALSLNRVDDINFTGGVFTNISQDHLDYYGEMDNYITAKTQLFNRIEPDGFRISNSDDDFAERFNVSGSATLYTYSIRQKSDFTWDSSVKFQTGISGKILYKDLSIPIKTRLSGHFNLYNILAATSAAIALGISPAAISTALKQINFVPGRLQEVTKPGWPRVFVDYAHTPDAIINVLTALRNIVPDNGKLITIFGCGGNRDKTKRPLMAKAAASLSDLAIITTDNPRFEEPDAIIDDAVPGFESGQKYERIVDRRKAIEYAVKNSDPADIIAILGKGHEDYQDIKGVKHPFSDVQIVNELIGNK